MPRNALGRGLSALIRDPEPNHPQPPPQGPAASLEHPPAPTRPTTAPGPAAAAVPALAPGDGLLQVDIDLIDPSPYHPRPRFREEALDELALSIRSSGIVQPLVVRRIGARHQLIAGERRWRAAQRAGLSRVPIVIRNVPDDMALEMTLVENLQREDLNPIEQAHAFQRLTDEFHLTQEQVAERTGKDRATIANALRLLKLEQPILDLLEGERLSTRAPGPRPAGSLLQPDPNMKAALEGLQREYGTRVLIQPRRAGKPGQLIFEYYDDSDLTRLYDQLMLK